MEEKRRIRKFLWLLPFIGIVFVCGCWIFSGTWVIIYQVEEADIHATQNFYRFTVDLSRESIWRDHKSELDDIDDISFSFKLANFGSSSATAQVYISADSTFGDTAQVKSSATLILDGLSVPPGDTLHVTLAHYYDLLQNFETLKELVKEGLFTAYIIVPNTLNIKFYDVVVIVTISASL